LRKTSKHHSLAGFRLPQQVANLIKISISGGV
jgi:hypothetical protein